jgi:hypothetical protein
MRAQRLQELEEMAAELLATARKLPPGPNRHNALLLIGRFRVQIAAMEARNCGQRTKIQSRILWKQITP